MWCGEHAWKAITGEEQRNSIGDPKLWRELNYGETIKEGDERLEGTVWHPVRYEECYDTKYFGGKPHRRAIGCQHDFCLIADDGSERCSKCGTVAPEA